MDGKRHTHPGPAFPLREWRRVRISRSAGSGRRQRRKDAEDGWNHHDRHRDTNDRRRFRNRHLICGYPRLDLGHLELNHGLLLRLPSSRHQLADLAGMVAVKRRAHRFLPSGSLGTRDKHRSPPDRLQRKPVHAQKQGEQRGSNDARESVQRRAITPASFQRVNRSVRVVAPVHHNNQGWLKPRGPVQPTTSGTIGGINRPRAGTSIAPTSSTTFRHATSASPEKHGRPSTNPPSTWSA